MFPKAKEKRNLKVTIFAFIWSLILSKATSESADGISSISCEFTSSTCRWEHSGKNLWEISNSTHHKEVPDNGRNFLILRGNEETLGSALMKSHCFTTSSGSINLKLKIFCLSDLTLTFSKRLCISYNVTKTNFEFMEDVTCGRSKNASWEEIDVDLEDDFVDSEIAWFEVQFLANVQKGNVIAIQDLQFKDNFSLITSTFISTYESSSVTKDFEYQTTIIPSVSLGSGGTTGMNNFTTEPNSTAQTDTASISPEIVVTESSTISIQQDETTKTSSVSNITVSNSIIYVSTVTIQTDFFQNETDITSSAEIVVTESTVSTQQDTTKTNSVYITTVSDSIICNSTATIQPDFQNETDITLTSTDGESIAPLSTESESTESSTQSSTEDDSNGTTSTSDTSKKQFTEDTVSPIFTETSVSSIFTSTKEQNNTSAISISITSTESNHVSNSQDLYNETNVYSPSGRTVSMTSVSESQVTDGTTNTPTTNSVGRMIIIRSGEFLWRTVFISTLCAFFVFSVLSLIVSLIRKLLRRRKQWTLARRWRKSVFTDEGHEVIQLSILNKT